MYRTRDAGRTWRPLSRGLPSEHSYDPVLRDALATDSNDPAGVYFGTRGGRVFASLDAGTTWTTVAEGLPAVTCVKATLTGPAPRGRRSR